MPARILYIADSLIYGGIESQLVNLVTRLDRTRFEPYILCLYQTSEKNFSEMLNGISLHVVNLGWQHADKIRGIMSIARYLNQIRPHWVQAENYHANLLTRLALPFSPSTKMIGSVRGVYTPRQALYERISHYWCQRIAVSANHVKNHLTNQAHVPPEKIVVIPNGIDLARFSLVPEPSQSLRGSVAGTARRVFLVMGRIAHDKQPHLIAEAIGQLNPHSTDMRTLIVGPVQHVDSEAMLRQSIVNHDLQDRVGVYSATSHPERYYHAVDIVILFTPSETLPCVMLEALAAGRPVIISPGANAAGVIQHGINGWVTSEYSAASLAHTLREVLQIDDVRLAAMRQACMRSVAAFSANAMVATYERLYTDLITPPKSHLKRP